MKYFISYGDEKFSKSLKIAGLMAKFVGGFDKIKLYGPADLNSNFVKSNKEILSIKRGAGLWLWKPYIIYETLLNEINDGDLVFYSDAGSFFVRNVRHIEKVMKNSDIWVSDIPFQEVQFTKEDAFRILDIDDAVKDTAQIQASFLCIRKSKESVLFIKEWLDKCCDINLLHPDNLVGKDCSEKFISHREDQSILSLLCKKRKIKPHFDPSQYGKYPELYTRWNFERPIMDTVKEYPVCIVLHRNPNISFKSIVKQVLLAFIPAKIGISFLDLDVPEEKRQAFMHRHNYK